jgi:hypothetical protein
MEIPRIVLTVFLAIMLNCVNWSITEATCLMNQIRSNSAGNVSAYLIETTVQCGLKNAQNLGAHLFVLGVSGNVEVRSIMRQIDGTDIERYSVIAVIGTTDNNGLFTPDNLIFDLGKIDNTQDQLASIGLGHFIVMLDLNGNLLRTARLKGWGLQPVSIYGAVPELTAYQKNYWKNYFDSIFVGVPTSSQDMAN